MQTYLISGVVMDIAAFKVSYSIGCDIDTTALRAARARSASIGAMEEILQKVQNANTHRNTHRLRRQNHAHTRAATSQFKGQVKLEGGL